MALKVRAHIHGRVQGQLIILALVCLGLLGGVSYDALMGEVSPWLVLGALVVGIAVGFAVARIFALSWHEETRKVIMSLDRTSLILIALYIAFRVFGEQLLGRYVHGVELSAISFALLAGILLGRVISIWRGVSRILKQQGIW